MMNTPTATPLTTDDHPHHWVIGEPDGAKSIGQCKACGERREFKNWLSGSDFITNEERRSYAA